MIAAEGVSLYIIDDDPSVRASLTRLLRAEGANPETFATAEDFLDFLPSVAGPACALLDIGLPGKSGIELHARLQALRPEIAVVFLTGHGDVPGAVTSMKRGAIDFLLKPFEAATLIAALTRAIERARLAFGDKATKRDIALRYGDLTPREREVLTHVIAGKRNKVIAAEIGTTEKTVKVHRGRIMEKMQVRSVADLVRAADKLGIKPTPSPPRG
ncbi:MAG: response regulator transcription factor [Betaproteobacteria bacterium]|nr:response regulator transcription factor [Betaproteobacteria bacterium]